VGGRVWVGCSGYDYAHWRGLFYPADLPHSAWFAAYAARFDTLEVNATFYRLPSQATVESWRERAPEGFRYAVKLSRFGSHRKHLKDPDTWLAAFLTRVAGLGPALGPTLVQLPPRWNADPQRLDDFLTAVDDLSAGLVAAPSGWAVEMRDERWLCAEVYEVLRAHGAALVLHDRIADHPRVLTAGWTYLRFHGPDPAAPYAGRYPDGVLDEAARQLLTVSASGGDCYAYFDNDAAAQATCDARRLRERLSRVE